ncbi:MAG: branched-chain amino acid transporter permease [Massilia sp.]|jgi:branched-chain amino acid transport system substrate-binding protein|nr:branched-chain amino acid transporter permease [Massilia sp.]
MNAIAGRSAIVAACATLLTLFGATACSSGSTAGGGSGLKGLPKSIPVTLIADKTGPQAFYGAQLEAGVRAGLAQVESSGVLKNSKIELTVKDTTSVQATATTVMARVVKSKPAAILGPSLSNEALPMAPLAQSAKIPFLVDTSPKGILDAGEYIYSMTTPHASQIPALASHLAKSVKNVTVIYSYDNPTVVNADAAAVAEFPKAGLKLVANIGTPLQSTDFAAVATKAISGKPDAIGVFGGGPMMPSVTKALRTAGYTGLLFGNMGADGTIASAGAQATAFIYMAEWAPGLPGQASTDFAKHIAAAAKNLVPAYPAVDGYNEVLFLAAALSKANSTDGPKLLAAMQSVAADGIDTPAGRSTFTAAGKRQLIDPSIVAEFKDGKVTAVRD